MSYLKPLATAFLSTLFTMQMPFDTTPPAHAQENDCAIYALAGAARMQREQVLQVTGLMDGPTLNDRDVEEGLRRLGLGTESARTFATREELERYLHTRGNAEFIVGWQLGFNRGIGHVVNARVTDGLVRYIDNQNQCDSPDPAAEPPRNEANAAIVYYAWDTNIQVQGVADLTLLMGGLSLQDTGNSSLVRRSESAGVPLRNPSFGNFTASCRNINLNTDFSRTSQYSLSAECVNAQGSSQGSSILLGGYITNNNAALRWQSGGGFGGSVRNCSIDVGVYTVLTCDAKNRRGSWQKVAINLDVEIENKNGRLDGILGG